MVAWFIISIFESGTLMFYNTLEKVTECKWLFLNYRNPMKYIMTFEFTSYCQFPIETLSTQR